MISYLRGKVIFQTEKFVVLDVNGVGYKIFLSKKSLSKLPKTNEDLKLFCFLNVRENALDLYGFSDQKELEFFDFLREIRGIGPKAALEIASVAPMEKFKEAVEKEDEKIIKEIFELGKKKAQIVIFELSRKIKKSPEEKNISEDESFQALLSLGFTKQKIKEAFSRISPEIKDSESKIKEALKILRK